MLQVISFLRILFNLRCKLKIVETFLFCDIIRWYEKCWYRIVPLLRKKCYFTAAKFWMDTTLYFMVPQSWQYCIFWKVQYRFKQFESLILLIGMLLWTID